MNIQELKNALSKLEAQEKTHDVYVISNKEKNTVEIVFYVHFRRMSKTEAFVYNKNLVDRLNKMLMSARDEFMSMVRGTNLRPCTKEGCVAADEQAWENGDRDTETEGTIGGCVIFFV